MINEIFFVKNCVAVPQTGLNFSNLAKMICYFYSELWRFAENNEILNNNVHPNVIFRRAAWVYLEQQ